MSVAVTNNSGTILISDGNSVLYIKKEKVAVYTDGTNVVVREDAVHYRSYPAADFTAPTGTATQIATAIQVFLDT